MTLVARSPLFILVGATFLWANRLEAIPAHKRSTPPQKVQPPISGVRQKQKANKIGTRSPLPPYNSASSRALTGRCISVLDGDTLLVLSGETSTKVRLYAIDAPEKLQPFGRQSKASLWELAFGQTLTVYAVPEQESEGVVGWVFAGKMALNAEQVRRGLAWWDQYSAPRESKIADLEIRARFSHTGLWRDKSPVSPWLWRAASTKERIEVPMRTEP